MPHQKAPRRAENHELDLEPAGLRGYLSQKLVFQTKQLLVVNLFDESSLVQLEERLEVFAGLAARHLALNIA